MLTLTAVVAGCLEPDPESTTKAAAASSAGASETAAANASNAPPLAVIQVLVEGVELVAENGTFAAEAGVNITFDASNSTDADGGELTYSWMFGDNLTSDNATLVHAFAQPGNETVHLTVMDSAGATGTANVTLVIASGGPAPGTVLREDVQTFGNAPGGTFVAAGCFATFSKTWVLVDVEEDGTSSGVQSVTVTMAAMTSTGLNAYTKLAFKDPAGAVIKEANSGSGAKKLEIPGPLAAGTYKVEAAVCSTYLSTMTNSPAVGGVAVYVAV